MTQFYAWEKDTDHEGIWLVEATDRLGSAALMAEHLDNKNGVYDIAPGDKKVEVVVRSPNTKEAYVMEVYGKATFSYFGRCTDVFITETEA